MFVQGMTVHFLLFASSKETFFEAAACFKKIFKNGLE